jgi:23S rRNA pseudouridine2457 synthase
MRYFIINKPCNMVSQFVSPHPVRLLGHLDFDFPPDIHAIGRLDSHSEGLLLLTTNKKVTRLLFDPKKPHKRTYIIKVKNKMSAENLNLMKEGVSICIKGGENYRTATCEVDFIEVPWDLFKNQYEVKEDIPHSWLKISIYEGKFHQVRKMCAAVGHFCIRLIRVSIEDLELGTLQPGEVKEIEEREFFRLLKIGY